MLRTKVILAPTPSTHLLDIPVSAYTSCTRIARGLLNCACLVPEDGVSSDGSKQREEGLFASRHPRFFVPHTRDRHSEVVALEGG